MRTLIIGCGYTGIALGASLAQAGHEVFGLRRTDDAAEELKRAGITSITADITQPGALEGLPGAFDWIVNLVSSSRGGVEVYREVYLEGTRRILAWLADTPPQKLVYCSSTSVYGQTDGSLVEEHHETVPASATASVLVETEKLLLAAHQQSGFPAMIVRSAGIYGPGRGHLFHKYLNGEATMAGEGERLINMIHVDDLAGVIHAALDRGRAGEIYNGVDAEPVTQADFYGWLAETLDRPMPPKADGDQPTNRKRAITHKRVSDRKLVAELSYERKFPTFREGYGAEIAKLRAAGKL